MIYVLNISFDFNFLPLLIVVAVAWLVPMLMSIFQMKRVPVVIMEIIAGFLIGHFLLDYSNEENIRLLEYLSLIGFIFLMFLSGLEIDVDQIMNSFPRKKITLTKFLMNPFLVGVVYFLFTLGFSILGTILLSFYIDLPDIWYFSLILITTSVGVIFPVLKSRRETTGHYGQMLIQAAAFADIASIILFTFTAFIYKNGFRADIILVIALFAAFYLFYWIGKRLNVMLFRKITFQLSHAADQISIRGTLLLIFLFVVLSQYLGEEIILLGAFLSGLLLSFFLHKDRSLLMIKLDGMGFGFFIPMFFIMVGVKFDLASLAEFDSSIVLFLIILLLVLYAVKIIPSFLWSRIFGWRRAFSGGILMSSRLSLIIAAAAIGLELGVITPGINASFILMAVVTCIVSPIIYNHLNPRQPYVGDKTVIIGGSSTGVLLARRLQMHSKSAVIVENNEDRYKELKKKGLPVYKGDAMNIKIYNELRLHPANYVVVDTGINELNVAICRLLKKEYHHEKIISKSVNSETDLMLRSLDVEVLDATRVLAATLESLVIRPTTYHALVDTFENYQIDDIEVSNKKIDGIQIKDIPFHIDCTLILVSRGNEKYVPHGETYIRNGDIITIFGTDTAIEDSISRLV